MNRKKTEKSLELELCFDEISNTWTILSSGGHGIPASSFEIALWKEIILLRNQVSFLSNRLTHLREMVAVINKECDEK
jgi:hypothetical protein